MMQIVILLMYLLAHAPEQREATERLAPRGWQGNFWGPSANQDRREGKIPKVPMTPVMTSWQNWGKQTLHDGDIVFRRGDARLLLGYFRFSRFVANADNSAFSHTGVVAIENGEPVVYDTTKAGVACQPFGVWILDNVGALGVKRLRPEHQGAVPKVLAYCRNVFQKQVPFDYELGLDDSKLYCVEMTEKAFRAAGIALSEPIALGDMEPRHGIPDLHARPALCLRVCDRPTLELSGSGLLSRQRSSWSLGVALPHNRLPGHRRGRSHQARLLNRLVREAC